MKILDPNGLVDNLYKYVQTNIEIAKVEIQEKIEDTIKKVALIAILAIICTLFLILQTKSIIYGLATFSFFTFLLPKIA